MSAQDMLNEILGGPRPDVQDLIAELALIQVEALIEIGKELAKIRELLKPTGGVGGTIPWKPGPRL